MTNPRNCDVTETDERYGSYLVYKKNNIQVSFYFSVEILSKNNYNALKNVLNFSTIFPVIINLIIALDQRA